MKNKIIVLSLCSIAVLFNACSAKLASVKTSSSPETKKGLIYYLPTAQFKVNASFEITKCPTDTDGRLLFNETSTIIPKSIADHSNSYSLDLSKLEGAMKDTDYEILLYDNGFIKSINAKSDDKTAEILKDVASGVISSVSTGLHIPNIASIQNIAGIKTRIAEIPKIKCDKNVIKALKNKNGNISNKKNIETSIANKKAYLIIIKDEDELNKAIKELHALNVNLKEINKIILKNTNDRTFAMSETFINGFKKIVPNRKIFKNKIDSNSTAQAVKSFTRYFKLDSTLNKDDSISPTGKIKGLVYRQPSHTGIKI